jgi:peptidoglycan-N-acetylglucosamine deacetylase
LKIFVVKAKRLMQISLVVVLVCLSVIYTQGSLRNFAGVFFNNNRKLPIYSVETSEKVVAISFDAAYGDTYTEEILSILEKYNVKTTFFLVGFWVDKYSDMVLKIDGAGHEIGNHSSTHPKMSLLTEQQITTELENTATKITDLIGKKPILFRPPYGDYNNRLIETAGNMGYYTIQWDVDSQDWRELGVKHVVDNVTKRVENGSIILFHNNAKYVTQFLPVILEDLQSKGYKIIPISELIHKENYYIDNTGKQKKSN